MLLSQNERLILEEKNVSLGGTSQIGTLVLTNERLVLESAINAKKKHSHKTVTEEVSLVSIPVDRIIDAKNNKKKFLKPSSLEVLYQETSVSFLVEEPQSWVNHILQTRNEATEPYAGKTENHGVTVNVGNQTSAPIQKETIEKQVVKVRCRYCGSLVDELEGNCPQCGARL